MRALLMAGLTQCPEAAPKVGPAPPHSSLCTIPANSRRHPRTSHSKVSISLSTPACNTNRDPGQPRQKRARSGPAASLPPPFDAPWLRPAAPGRGRAIGGYTERGPVQFAVTVPSVLDRFIQQAVMQVLQRRWDRTFSDHSYGFRPGRSAHQAVAQAQQYIAEGHGWCVDLDLEKFFDRVNHDKLMGQIAKRVEDKRLLKLIRAFLNAGVMENGLVSPSVEGTPQGGPLTPLTQKVISAD
ncbi:MAG TPA: reverse transcriptase domain-containing protein [Bryobacteraceae bacterium]